MDPYTALMALRADADAGDEISAIEAAAALGQWLADGGFAPIGMTAAERGMAEAADRMIRARDRFERERARARQSRRIAG